MGILARSKDRTIVYLQNSGFLNGNVLNSLTLSCEGKHDEVEGIIKHLASFTERNHVTYPIRWENFMEKDPFVYKNTEGEFICDQLRDRCMIVGKLKFQGGHIYGGKKGDKFIQEPLVDAHFLPFKMNKKLPIIMSTCKFDGDHKCDVNLWKGSVDDIKNYQKIVTKMVVKRELNHWKSTSHRKKSTIVTTLSKIQKDLNQDEM